MRSILDEVDPATRETLLAYGFDAEQFARLQGEVASARLSPEGNVLRGDIEPPAEGDLVRMPDEGMPGWSEAYERGMAALRRGEVAIAVLNGGMATRFGGVVKGVVEAVDGRTFLEWKLAEAARVARAAGADIPCAVMNSFATDAATRAFLADLGERAADLPRPTCFTQFISLRLNRDGSLFCDEEGRPSLYAPGHGDFPEALRRSGTLAQLRDRGVRVLLLSNVDNLGARVDPVVVGMHLLAGRPMTVEVAAKEPGDRGGAPARVDGRTIVVEQFRFPSTFDQDRVRVFNTNSFVFDLEILEDTFPLTWFYVEKSVGATTVVQLERLVGEISSFVPATFLEVPRIGPRGRFFPIKEPEDLPAAQAALRHMIAQSLTDTC